MFYLIGHLREFKDKQIDLDKFLILKSAGRKSCACSAALRASEIAINLLEVFFIFYL